MIFQVTRSNICSHKHRYLNFINPLHPFWVYLKNAEIKLLLPLFKRILPHQEILSSSLEHVALYTEIYEQNSKIFGLDLKMVWSGLSIVLGMLNFSVPCEYQWELNILRIIFCTSDITIGLYHSVSHHCESL